MNSRTPSLRLHATGQWFVRWGGKDHYFGTDKIAAKKRFLADRFDGLPAWIEWRETRDRLRLPSLRASMTVGELIKRFVANRRGEGGDDRAHFYRCALKYIDLLFGKFRADTFRATHLQNIKDKMVRAKLAPKTINHMVQAVRTMFQWAMDLEMIPPVNLRGVKKLPLPPFVDKSWPRHRVLRFILGCSQENMKAWLAVNYLTGMRPKEVVRVVTGEGKWIQLGVLVIPNKARAMSRMPRHVLFSEEALEWLPKCRPVWTRLDSYSQAIRDNLKVGPHALRHSAATHLLEAGVSREFADQILGHYPRQVSLSYMMPQWRQLREKCALLTLR